MDIYAEKTTSNEWSLLLNIARVLKDKFGWIIVPHDI